LRLCPICELTDPAAELGRNIDRVDPVRGQVLDERAAQSVGAAAGRCARLTTPTAIDAPPLPNAPPHRRSHPAPPPHAAADPETDPPETWHARLNRREHTQTANSPPYRNVRGKVVT
jgi:hypothetical protein